MNDILSMYDRRKQIDMAILDFTEALEKVPDNNLLLKLENYGNQGKIHRWITSLLKGRHQRLILSLSRCAFGSQL